MKNTLYYGDCLRINRLALLEFYDTIPKDSIGHASSINAVLGEDLGSGLLKHYFENVKKANVSILDEKVNMKSLRGNRLDRWILVKRTDGETLYQVEIKNWSAQTFDGPGKLSIDATADQVADYKRDAWKREWNEELRELRRTRTCKVLLPMKTSSECKEILPLLCMWAAMHPKGDIEPFFAVELSTPKPFSHLWVFSMSAYLRMLPDAYLELEIDMPQTIQRLSWLNRLFVDR